MQENRAIQGGWGKHQQHGLDAHDFGWVGVTGSFLQVLVMIVGSDIVDPLSYVVRIQGGKNTRISEWNGWKASFVGMHSRELISEILDIDTHLIFGFSLGRALQLEF